MCSYRQQLAQSVPQLSSRKGGDPTCIGTKHSHCILIYGCLRNLGFSFVYPRSGPCSAGSLVLPKSPNLRCPIQVSLTTQSTRVGSDESNFIPIDSRGRLTKLMHCSHGGDSPPFPWYQHVRPSVHCAAQPNSVPVQEAFMAMTSSPPSILKCNDGGTGILLFSLQTA